MSTSTAIRDIRVADVEVSEATLTVTLRDGRRISAPLDWYPRLKNASREERAAWEPAAAGYGVHWPLVDEDLSVEGLLHGGAAPSV